MRLFVGGLSFTTTEADLEAWLIRWKVTPLSCIIARNAEKQSMRYGFIRIPDTDADTALKLKGKYFAGNAIMIRKERAPKPKGKL